MKPSLNLPLRQNRPLLICETDGFSLRAAVVAKAGHRLQLQQQARVDQVDMGEALADVLETLKAGGWPGGGRAILLSPAVLSALIELPVNPNKPRPMAQMLELIRWEVEPLLMQHLTRWSVGNLLVGRGHMTEEQAQAVMDLQQGRPNAAGGLALQDQFPLRRFGELAEELGYIKRSQLNACLTGQEWLRSDDERIECGWSGQGAVTDVPGSFNWLVSCIHQPLLQRWSNLFARNGLKLQAAYPLTGNSRILLEDKQSPTVLMEAHHGSAFATRLKEGQIESQRYYLKPGKTPLETCLETYHAMRIPPTEALWLAGWDVQTSKLADDLAEMLSVDVHELSLAGAEEGMTPGMAGAAYHVLGLADPHHCAGVREGGPLPPLPQRLEIRAAALAVLLLAVIAVAELSLMLRLDAANTEKQALDARWQVVDQSKRRIDAKIAQIKQRQQALDSLQNEYRRHQAILDFYGRAVPERVALIKHLLGGLQLAVNDEVVVTALDEPARSDLLPPNSPTLPAVNTNPMKEVESFNLSAWAVSETAAQNFIQNLTAQVADVSLEIRDAQVSSGKGPLNLDGFSVVLRLVKLEKAAKT